MGIFWIVTVLMMSSVHRDPFKHGALNRHGAKYRQNELNCAIILISQLNRELEKRPDKRPVLSDLRQSGSIEQDADTVLFIYRDIVYNASANKEDAEQIIAKQRNGATAMVPARFTGYNTKFTSDIPKPF